MSHRFIKQSQDPSVSLLYLWSYLSLYQRIHLLFIFLFRVFVSQSGCGLSKYQDTKIVGGERIKPNQYPWLCSLKTDRGSHICGVTLLGIHPHVKETILVGAAHCYNEGNLNLPIIVLNTYYLHPIYLHLTFFFSLKYRI